MARILLAEDDKLYCEMVKIMLERDGHQVVAALNGKECLRHLDHDDGFDVIVTDLLMPLCDGIAVAATIRRNNISIPLIGMTGGLNANLAPLIKTMLALGTRTVLAKPFSIDELRKTLEGVLEAPA